jgi:hypothetical protein
VNVHVAFGLAFAAQIRPEYLYEHFALPFFTYFRDRFLTYFWPPIRTYFLVN